MIKYLYKKSAIDNFNIFLRPKLLYIYIYIYIYIYVYIYNNFICIFL